MDHLIGQRFSLISKSEIRYVGILHEINPEEATIALQEVFSFGTEDRLVDKFIPPSQQKFEYILFRGTDVKDIKIEEALKENKQPSQPPHDPAILNSSRPPSQQPPQGPAHGPPPNRGESPFPPPNYPPPGQFGGYYPPPPPPPPAGQFGRGYGPPPGPFGPGSGYPPYGPPPGYFGPPGQGFPQRQGSFPQPPAPIGPPEQRPPTQPQQPPSGPAPAAKQTTELPVEKNISRNGSKSSTPAPQFVAPQPVASQPPKSIEPPQQNEPVQLPPATKAPPTGPKSKRVAPAMPFQVNRNTFTPPVSSQPPPQSVAQAPASKQGPSHNEMEEASRQAKQAVAAAMAQLSSQPTQQPPPPQTTSSVETLVEKVSQMTTAPTQTSSRGRGNYRDARGARTSSGGQRQKMEIPQSDFDFETANAKFNKEDLIKEAIASGSPLAETAENDPLSAGPEGTNGTFESPSRKDSLSQTPAPAYNKSTSFFDNISSEARDREDTTNDGRFNARTARGQEFKKNIETFGQGNVDSGYRGRGRGGYRGRGRGSANYDNRNNSYRGGYRGRGRGVNTAGDGMPQGPQN